MSKKNIIRLLIGILFVGLAVFVALRYGDQLNTESLVARETEFREFEQKNPVKFFASLFAVYVAATALSIPGATLLTLLTGTMLGFGKGFLLVSFASTLGATLAFLVSRFVIGDMIRDRYGEKLTEINQKLEKEGPFFLFSLRLIPLVPFFLVNLLMGLTPIKVWTYWWVSQLGMLAGTAAYVYAGSQLPSLKEISDEGIKSILSPGLIIAFVLLAILPFLLRFILSQISSKRNPSQPS